MPETRLFNPIPCADGQRTRVGGADIAKNEHEYLFHGVLAGVFGVQSAIIGTVILKLNNKLRELGIEPYYNPDNESIVAGLLANLNFDTRPEPSGNGPASGTGTVANDTGRVDGPTNSEPGGSARPRAKRSATPSIRRRKSDKTRKRADDESVTPD